MPSITTIPDAVAILNKEIEEWEEKLDKTKCTIYLQMCEVVIFTLEETKKKVIKKANP